MDNKSAGSKRAIGYLMQSGHHLEDFDAVWAKMTKAAETSGGDVTTADNISEVNMAIAKQAK